MPLRRRTEKDGITERTVITHRIDEPLTAEEQREVAAHRARLNFEASIAPIKQAALDVRRREWDGTRQYASEYGSRSWYAEHVLSLIERIRQARDIETQTLEDRERRGADALWAAVLIGHALAESAAKGWPIVANVRRGSVQGGKERGKEIGEDNERLRELIRTEAAAYRRRHPYDRMGANTSRLSQHLVTRCSTLERQRDDDEDARDGQRSPRPPLKPDTVRKHLNKLGIK